MPKIKLFASSKVLLSLGPVDAKTPLERMLARREADPHRP